MTAMTSAGTTLAIAVGAPASLDDTGFEALAPYTVIGEITDVGGDLGTAYNLATHNPLATRATGKLKGAYNAGSLSLTLALDEDDAGQSMMQAALASRDAYSFKLTRQDGSILYFQAMVMSFPETYGGADTIVGRTASLEITATIPPDPYAVTRLALREYLATTDGADNPHSLGAMASPPTITTSTSSAIWVVPLVLNAPGALDSVLLEGGAPTFSPTNMEFLRPEQGSVNAGTAIANRISITSRVSVNVNASAVAFNYIGTGIKARFLADGQYVDFVGTAPPSSTGTGANRIILTFAGKAEREVTTELQISNSSTGGTWLRTISLLAGDTFLAPPAGKPVRGIWVSDSLGSGTGATAKGDGFIPVAADYLGFDLWPSGSGSTGYTADATGTKYNFAQRVAADLDLALASGPVDVVGFSGGLNDSLANQTEIDAFVANLKTCFDTARAKCPNALVFVTGEWDRFAPSDVDAAYLTKKALIQAAVAGRPGFYFLDNQGVAYTKTDGTHPDDAGHTTLGLWLDSAVRAALA